MALEPTQSPKAFISYSWSSPEHQEWVRELAEQLVKLGVDVKFDKWDLQPGHDAFAFMEGMVSDPTITKVIIVCDKQYVNKANSREGGAGTEAQIITPEIYARKEQDKYVAVVRELDEDGKPIVPVFYKGRIYINLSESDTYGGEFERLLRWLFDKPLDVKPKIGTPPAFLNDDYDKRISSSAQFKRAIDAIKNSKSYSLPATIEYLDTIVAWLNNFRLKYDHKINEDRPFDDEVVGSIEAFQPYKNDLIELFLAISAY